MIGKMNNSTELENIVNNQNEEIISENPIQDVENSELIESVKSAESPDPESNSSNSPISNSPVSNSSEESEESEEPEESEVSEESELSEVVNSPETNQSADSVQIAPTDESNPVGQPDDPMLFIQLGDRVVIDSDDADSDNYGRTIGTVYYRSLDMIRIKPDGVSNTLRNFELEQTEEEELYKDNITAAYVIEKRVFESFVEQQDFRVNQLIDTFDSYGKLFKQYKILKVDAETDSIQIQDEDDIHDLHFNYTGIDPEEPFNIISIRQFSQAQEEGQEAQEGQEGQVEEVQEQEEEYEIKILGSIQITRPKVYTEASYFEQKIPDNIQKIDALNDFINSLDSSFQKNPKIMREQRIVIETLFNLKHATLEYNNDGSVKGKKNISASTLSELIKYTPIPLGRPILNVKKKLYIFNTEDEKEDEDIYFENFNNEQTALIQNKSSLVSSTMVGAPGGKIIREWNDQQAFLKNYLSPWTSTAGEPVWRAIKDTDFFRTSPPQLEDGTFLDTISGYIPTRDKANPVVFDKIHFGLERALDVIYRKGLDKKKHVLLPEDSSSMNSYLLFPIKTANALGTTRSSRLVIDSGRSQMKKETMKSILQKTGEPTEAGTSNNLILLDVIGNTLGNIPLADYIDGISIPALGIGDTFTSLEQYGMNELELTPDIINVLTKKIDLYQLQLISTLSILREKINVEQKEVEQNPFIVSDVLDIIRSQPTLVEDVIEYEKINPILINSDIGKVAYLMKKHPYYFQVTLGKNVSLISKEILALNNMNHIHSKIIENIIKYNELNKGEVPVPNTCKHVNDLVSVRRIQNDTERFQKLIDFFRKYQGDRDDNWINCYKCDKHLLCIHERLQIQAFLIPKEQDNIQKEIILKFSGGQFQGKYICRNCGQSIKDIDFDNNIEFDDDGKPKSGRAVIIDDAFEDQLSLMTVPMVSLKELVLNDNEKIFYNVIKDISERVGITLDNDGMKKVIDRSIIWANKYPRNEYNEKKKKTPTMPDYDIAISRIIISACATFLIIEIQTKIPSYIPRYNLTECKNIGFQGYPLDTNIKNTQCIEYIACAISSIKKNETPWNQTGFQKIEETKRLQGITFYINNIIKEFLSDNVFQSELNEKRTYLEESIINVPKDNIYPTFLPEQIILTPEDAAKDVIVTDVTESGNIKLWIRQAHLLAKRSSLASVSIETSCCMSSIEGPGAFWNDKNLPTISKRTLVPKKQGDFLMTIFNPRASASDVIEPDKELYYRLFLKCCFQGPRIGYPHEPGLLNSCQWCEFQFPTIPSIMDTDTEGKSALLSQNVNTGSEEFINLLDMTHKVNNVNPFTQVDVLSTLDIMNAFSLINPPPISNWKEIIVETTNNVLALQSNADKGDIAMASSVISDATQSSNEIISRRSPQFQQILKEIIKLSWSNFFQVIQSYFIIPFHRLLSQFNSKSLDISIELKIYLSDTHVEDLLPIFNNDTALLKMKGEYIKDSKSNLAKSKITYFLKQMSAIVEYKNKIRPNTMLGHDNILLYIQRTLLYGPLATLLNPSEIPEEFKDTQEFGNTSMKFIVDIIEFTLKKFSNEKLTFNDQEIKEMIAIRDEKERTNIIAEYSKLSDEERAVELMNQRLGLGKYAVGGTKLIYAYDKDYYDLERQKRFAAGIEIPVSNEEEGYDHNQNADD